MPAIAKLTMEARQQAVRTLTGLGIEAKAARALAGHRNLAEDGKPGRIVFNRDEESNTGEILIYEVIGFDWWTGEGMTAKRFDEELKALGDVDEILLRINSPGGDVFDGFAIYNMLARLKARIVVEIDGLAASIASVVAMAGDVIRIAENGSMMIHDAWGCCCGNGEDMRAMAEILDRLDGQIARTYAKRSGRKDAEIRAWMYEETWFNGEEAVEAGLADELLEAKTVARDFDLSQFRNAPEVFVSDATDETSGVTDATKGLTGEDDAEAVDVRLRLLEIDGDSVANCATLA